MKKEMKWKLLLILGILLFLLIINYFVLLPINIRYTETFIVVLLFALLIYLLFGLNVLKKRYINVQNQMVLTATINDKAAYVLIGAFLLVVVYSISSTPLFFSKQYKSLIGEVEERDFISDFEVVSNDELPIVDYTYASKLGDKKLGTDRGLGSEFHVGTFTDITVNGEMKMVAPLEFNDFFKWLNNGTTPGYVIVDKITGDVELVTEIGGTKLALKYLDSAYFQNDLKRHVYFNGNMDDRLYDFNFEIDDEGNPYYIVTKTHKTIGINGGDDVKSVIVVDIQTGEMKEYKPEDVPSWVDTVYPNELCLKQLDDWGLYVHGFFNTLFGEKDIVRNTEGTRVVLNNGNLYHYTGMTSAGNDDSTVGFAFINMRTKETTFYKMTGATEQAAMRSAEGKVENFGYTASFPIPTNINDIPTFFTPLKDSSGLIKQYAFINIEDFSVVGTGETITGAMEAYLQAMNKDYIGNEEDAKEITGTIIRVGFDIRDGITNYYYMLEGDLNLYYGSSSISMEMNITNVGDQVSMTVNNGKIIKFDNLAIG